MQNNFVGKSIKYGAFKLIFKRLRNSRTNPARHFSSCRLITVADPKMQTAVRTCKSIDNKLNKMLHLTLYPQSQNCLPKKGQNKKMKFFN